MGAAPKSIPYDWLPPLPPRDPADPFAWLRSAPKAIDPVGTRQDGDEDVPLPVRLTPLTAEARALNLAIPAPFAAFLSAPDLISRVPSCTACYLDLPTRLIPLPGGQPGRLLRFLNDQQCCLLWYLHLTPDGAHSVLSGWPEFHDAATGPTLEDISTPRDLALSAPGFVDFLHRFWLENTLWYAVQEDRPFSADERAYADAAMARAASG
jgi:hypothetical protein